MPKRDPDPYYFINKAKEKFSNKYAYDLTTWVSNKDKMTIICPEHGEFYQTPTYHFKSNGCPTCIKEQMWFEQKEGFISDAKKIHGEKYDYSLVEYAGETQKVKIVCSDHGVFEQDRACHIYQKQGCPTCGALMCVESRKQTYNLDWFLKEAKEAHGDYYNYEKVKYLHAHARVVITCPVHGDFNQKPSVHLNGSGCRRCGITRRAKASQKGLEQWIKEALAVHGDKYDYSKSVYLGNNHKITVTCPEHGDFSLIPVMHLRGNGCKPCGVIRRSKSRSGTTDEFIKKAKKVHNNQYEYPGEYTTSKDKIKIICPKHGEFYQLPNDHLDGHGCIKCSNQRSQYEEKLEKFLKSVNIQYKRGDRTGVAGKGTKYNLELDFYLPDLNLAIEVNGEKWHSSEMLNGNSKTWDWVKNHQKRKQDNCKENGVFLLHFYADEIDKRFPQIQQMILAKAGMLKESIPARKTEVKDLLWDEAANFMEKYHIQGPSRPFPVKGLYHKDILVAVMVFGPLTSHRGNQDDSVYELIRYCSATRVIGGCSKLLKSFLGDVPKCKTVVSYSDNRLSDGKMYESMGFKMVKESKVDYVYISSSFEGRKHKSNFRRERLAKMLPDFDPALTERENCHNHGYYQLYDCGKKRWELTVSP